MNSIQPAAGRVNGMSTKRNAPGNLDCVPFNRMADSTGAPVADD